MAILYALSSPILQTTALCHSGQCLFVCRTWYDLIYATNTLLSTIIIDEMFFGGFCTHHTRFQEHSVVHFVHTCLERSPPAEKRLRWDWKGPVRHVCNKFGSPHRPIPYLEKWVTEAVTFNRCDTFKRCSDLKWASLQVA